MKIKRYLLIRLLLLVLLVVCGLLFFLYQRDKYTFMRYVDRYSYLLFRVTPFGGKPFEKFSENTYILGNYVYKTGSNSESYIYSAIGTIQNIGSNVLTLKYHDSVVDIFLSDTVQVIVSVPEAELPNKIKLIPGNISMLEIGDNVASYILTDGKFNQLILYKKFYDRNKLVN